MVPIYSKWYRLNSVHDASPGAETSICTLQLQT
ncbi:hypothetical protein AcdelDRAFT_0083 [Acidovorax delafieldii 2AN]|jgi:hypothetical protein|uniref:Uncharacterized protein n=1 Tax=Acidovorax delafieldii 2AN TaxID=573060 RepID=C5SZK3_ACIDE|nr:hypothetical protein AcdelDRAFT_0083 [Acidovorax delafieldii 2AN]